MAIQGKQYSGADLQIYMLGKPVAGVREVKYSGEKESTDIYALGSSKPVSVASGKKMYSGTMVILQSELIALQRSLPAGKDLLDISEFDIVCSYVDDATLVVNTDILKSVRFKKFDLGLNIDDPYMEVKLDIVIRDIQLSV